MKKLEENDVLPFVASREEGRRLEFKPGFDWTDGNSQKIREEVIKTIIAMHNTPQGGDIVLGKVWDSTTRRHLPTGVTTKQKDYFLNNYEAIEQEVHKFCSRTPSFEIQWGEASLENKTIPFIFIRVDSFTEFPVLTTTNGNTREDSGMKDFVIKENSLYVRSVHAPWSSKRATWREFEEVIMMSADKHKQALAQRGYVKAESLDAILKKERKDYD